MLNLDTRDFSRLAYDGLNEVKKKVRAGDYGKASSAVQGLPAYISTWGLHRLAGDLAKYNKRGEKTEYRGHVYQQFLLTLKKRSPIDFNPDKPEALINTLMNTTSLHEYTGLNRLAIELAREWSFWAVPVLGEAKEE